MTNFENLRESTIESNIRLYAEAEGWLSYKIEKTTPSGLPDRLFIKNGRIVFMEIKRSSGSVQKNQNLQKTNLLNHGVEVYVVRKLEEAILILQRTTK